MLQPVTKQLCIFERNTEEFLIMTATSSDHHELFFINVYCEVRIESVYTEWSFNRASGRSKMDWTVMTVAFSALGRQRASEQRLTCHTDRRSLRATDLVSGTKGVLCMRNSLFLSDVEQGCTRPHWHSSSANRPNLPAVQPHDLTPGPWLAVSRRYTTVFLYLM